MARAALLAAAVSSLLFLPLAAPALAGCPTFTIAASAKMGGTISPSGAVPVTCQQTFTITSGPCYTIGAVIVDGVNVGAVPTYTFLGVTGDHTIHAEFLLDNFLVVASAGIGGTIAPSGTRHVDCGASAGTYAVTPDADHVISNVWVDGVSIGAATSYAFTNVHADRSIVAEFSPRGTLGDARTAEGDAGSTSVAFRLSLPATALAPVSVHYQSQDGSATAADNDFTATSGDWTLLPPAQTFTSKWGTSGTGPGQFANPNAVAVDDSDYVYVADLGRNRVQKFSANGAFIRQWGTGGSADGQFSGPGGVAADHSGRIYVTDSNNHRVQVFTPTGAFLFTWGGFGSGPGQFFLPFGIDVDVDGSVYVADQFNDRVQKFTRDGTFLAAFGTFGTGPGQFNQVSDVAVDEKGNLFVSDFGNHRIQKLTIAGAYVTSWVLPGAGAPRSVAVDGSGAVFVTDVATAQVLSYDATGGAASHWGAPGSGNGQFNDPYGVAVNTKGQVYVVDRSNNRIQKFSPASFSGVLNVAVKGDVRNEPNETFGLALTSPVRVALPKSTAYGLIVNDDPLEASIADASVAEGDSGSTPLGFTVRLSGPTDLPVTLHYQTADGSATQADNDYASTSGNLAWAPSAPAFVTRWGSLGSANGQFDLTSSPFAGIAEDAAGNVYATDRLNTRVQKFGPGGAFVAKWGTSGAGPGQFADPTGIAVDAWGCVYVVDNGNARIQKFDANGVWMTAWGAAGSGSGEFADPLGIAVDASGFVYVVDRANAGVQKFDAQGGYVSGWGVPGSANGEFTAPVGVAVDAAGFVYVADGNQRVQKFDASGAFVTAWGTPGAGDGQFTDPAGIAVDASGSVYVVDAGDRVQKFAADGTFIAAWGSAGNGDGQFQTAQGIAVDANGVAMVSDAGLHRVQKFATPAPTLAAIVVNVKGDSKLEPNETFDVMLTSPLNVTLPDAAATGTIANDDTSTTVAVPPAAWVFEASVSPNPARRPGVLAFTTTGPGWARVEVFDASGRRVRTLLETPELGAGPHRLAMDHEAGPSLPTGLYLYRVSTREGTLGGRFVLIR